MKKYILILCAACVLLALLLPGCGSSPNATVPRVMVNGYLYSAWTNPKPVETLPEGYALAGTLERVSGQPREDMTGNVPKGTELYTCPTAPEAVYIRVPGRNGYSLYKLDFLPPTQMPGEN